MAKSKKILISKIKQVIGKFGGFGFGDVENFLYCSKPCVNSMGNLVALAEYFNENNVEINIYDAVTSSDSISDYTLEYEDLSVSILEEIWELCTYYRADCEKAEENIQ